MDIMDKIKDVSRSVVMKSGEFAESGKLTINIKKKEKDIRNLKLEIGQMVYEAYKKGYTFDEAIAEMCSGIDAASQEILKLEEERERVGIGDLQVEVIDAEIPDDEDFEASDEEDEILRVLGDGSETDL